MPGKTEDVPLSKGFREELELLGRHIKMIQFVQEHGPIGIIRLSTLLGVPKHKVRYSLRILEKEGFILPSTAGASATEKCTKLFASLEAILKDVREEIEGLLGTLKKG